MCGRGVAAECGLEGACHADPVLVLGKPVVGLRARERPLGEEVVLISGVHQAPAEGPGAQVLPLLHRVDDGRGLAPGVGPHGRIGGVVAHPERHAGNGGEIGVLVDEPGQGRLERVGIVQPGAHHDLSVHFDASVEEGAQPSQAGGTAGIAQHPGPELGIGAVDRDEQGRQTLGEDTFEVELGEAGESCEIPVQERQPVVVVLEVEAASHALGELVDEAELAVVVTGTHPVEHRRGHFDPRYFARLLAQEHGELLVTPSDLELGVGFVDEEAVLDDVSGHTAVNRQQLVVHLETGSLCRGGGRHGDHPRRRHDIEATWSLWAPRFAGSSTPGRSAWVGAGRACTAGLAPRFLRRGGKGDQGPGVDGPGLRASGLLLPRDRPQPARGRPIP